MNELTGQFERTKEPLKIDPLGMGIVVFLLGILVVQTFGMFLLMHMALEHQQAEMKI